jgi:hypothetical protein
VTPSKEAVLGLTGLLFFLIRFVGILPGLCIANASPVIDEPTG